MSSVTGLNHRCSRQTTPLAVYFGVIRVQECQEYLREQNHNVGCRIPLKDSLHRFHSFDAKLSDGGNQSICKKYPEMTKIVKLHPPSNISVNSSSREGEVCVCWIRSKIKPDCVNYTVGYQKDSGLWKFSTPKSSTSFCVSPVSSGVVYTFKVRSGISDMCGPSNFWSDWSDSVQWINNEGDVSVGQPQSFWHILGSVVAVITFIILVLLLIYSERIRVSVAPDPTKSLQDLFKKYNGNVESWVYISRELKDAFDPDYTESPCVVSEPSLTLETKTKDVPMEQPVS
ncbi:interleukin 2 receptor, gamma b [Silurus meridionalis]|uniref:Fibronectin type-III domain-containing protein n=1 Tax=Silurus meridionalis TaxID=175797 RepID=A0A8T0BJB8_SILME|nr:interleukin 2 receptor, gamma b [Silurus meridionalis]XP_046705493.1 interleukin 2 receptor, gamma b [Silurus meridionalis]XP_046705494.1 interleukin 2 receptor, gamma b [Silurus meridionalis]KAF7707342.1 hypothetical protein HF521_018560 [Silurus meridionalis]